MAKSPKAEKKNPLIALIPKVEPESVVMPTPSFTGEKGIDPEKPEKTTAVLGIFSQKKKEGSSLPTSPNTPESLPDSFEGLTDAEAFKQMVQTSAQLANLSVNVRNRFQRREGAQLRLGDLERSYHDLKINHSNVQKQNFLLLDRCERTEKEKKAEIERSEILKAEVQNFQGQVPERDARIRELEAICQENLGKREKVNEYERLVAAKDQQIFDMEMRAKDMLSLDEQRVAELDALKEEKGLLASENAQLKGLAANREADVDWLMKSGVSSSVRHIFRS